MATRSNAPGSYVSGRRFIGARTYAGAAIRFCGMANLKYAGFRTAICLSLLTLTGTIFEHPLKFAIFAQAPAVVDRECGVGHCRAEFMWLAVPDAGDMPFTSEDAGDVGITTRPFAAAQRGPKTAVFGSIFVITIIMSRLFPQKTAISHYSTRIIDVPRSLFGYPLFND